MGSLSEMIHIRARTVAVVGAGPSGIIAAKYLRAEKAFDKIILFEQRSRCGGIWNYTGNQRTDNLFNVPQISPAGLHQEPEWIDANINTSNDTNGAPTKRWPSYLSPIYEKLETNIPRGLMGFQDLDWPTDSQLFPTHETVLSYIEEYSKDVQDLIQYETQVMKIDPLDPNNITGKWNITTINLRTRSSTSETFDAVIVANGHFIVPNIAAIPNIKAFNTAHPGVISHSKYYRRPEEFANKKVVVIGNSASGLDISNQLAPYVSQPLLWSFRSTSIFNASPANSDPRKREHSPIAKFLPESRGVEFEDGTIEHDIDAILFATGYLYSLPFLSGLTPPPITTGTHVNHTYKHLFYHPRPTLSFLTLQQRVIPFPLAESQSAVLARIYAGRLFLPSKATMQAWERDTIAEMGDGKNFHLLPFPKDGNYINDMAAWAMSAERTGGLDNEGVGKCPPAWGEWEFWCREMFPKIRQAFGKLGEKRYGVRTLEEVGFSYDEYLKTKTGGEGKLI